MGAVHLRRSDEKNNAGEVMGVSGEADTLLKRLFEYAKVKRAENVYDFTAIMDGFYKLLSKENYEDNGRNTLTNRFLKIAKEYVQTDPRHQLRIDQFRAVEER